MYPKVPRPTTVDGTLLVEMYPKVPRPTIVELIDSSDAAPDDRYVFPRPLTVDSKAVVEI